MQKEHTQIIKKENKSECIYGKFRIMTTYLEKSCSFGLLCMSFLNIYKFVCVLLSLLVLRVGCEILLSLFLIIVFLLTLYRFMSL